MNLGIRYIALCRKFKEVLKGNSLLCTGGVYIDVNEYTPTSEGLVDVKEFRKEQHAIIFFGMQTIMQEALLQELLKKSDSELLHRILSAKNGVIKKLIPISLFDFLGVDKGKILKRIVEDKSDIIDDKFVAIEEFYVTQKIEELSKDFKGLDCQKLLQDIKNVPMDKYIKFFFKGSFSSELIRVINDPDNQYLLYRDPNHDLVFRVKLKELLYKKKDMMLYVTKPINCVIGKNVDNNKASTCLLVALLMIKERDDSLKRGIDFIYKEESKAIYDADEYILFKDALKKGKTVPKKVIDEYRAQGYVLGKLDRLSFRNIKGDDRDIIESLNQYLDKKTMNKIEEFIEKTERAFLNSASFYLRYYIGSAKSGDDISIEDLNTQYKSYKKKCDLNYEPIATLTSRLHALYQQVAIGSGFNILTFKGSVDIEKSLLGLEGREQGRDAKISSSQKGSTIF